MDSFPAALIALSIFLIAATFGGLAAVRSKRPPVPGEFVSGVIRGKQDCCCGVLEKGIDRLTAGMGMMPRGGVG